jgi:hypothetical protein
MNSLEAKLIDFRLEVPTEPTTSMTNTNVLTTNEYQFKIQKTVDALKARIKETPYIAPENERDKVLLHFASRGIQIGEACFRIGDLQTPLFILARVLCEDFLLMFWASQSEKNAAEYSKKVQSEMARMLTKSLTNKRARLREKKSGKVVTEIFLPKLAGFISKRKHLGEIARESGLEKVYDRIYPFNSLEVHGNTLGLCESNPAHTVAVALSAINAFLRAILNVVDAGDNPLTAAEILELLNMQNVVEA